MRGRPKSSAAATAKAKSHAKRAYYCACGAVVHGNGGRAGHFGTTGNKRAGHKQINVEDWRALRRSPWGEKT